MRHALATGTLLAALAFAGAARLSAQNAISSDWRDYMTVADDDTVYDTINHVTWLRNANLAGTPASSNGQVPPDDQPPRFGLPLCDVETPDPCIWANGMMSYLTAQEWVARMNAASYLGHSHWRLPSTPFVDAGCPGKGPSGESFGFGCTEGAMGSLFYIAFDLKALDTAVPIPPNTVGPFTDFQPGIYWSSSWPGGLPSNKANFSFATGADGGGTPGDFSYVLPMHRGRLDGGSASTGTGLELSSDGLTVYDHGSGITWPVNADLVTKQPFSLELCKSPHQETACYAADGEMNYASAAQFVADMTTAKYGAKEGTEENVVWELPTIDRKTCGKFGCTVHNPMGELFYTELGLQAGESVVPTPDVAVGPFHNLQPDSYWSCEADKTSDPCSDESVTPKTHDEFGFSWGNGFVGTSHQPALHFVMVYFVGCDLPDASECIHVKDPGPRKF